MRRARGKNTNLYKLVCLCENSSNSPFCDELSVSNEHSQELFGRVRGGLIVPEHGSSPDRVGLKLIVGVPILDALRSGQ